MNEPAAPGAGFRWEGNDPQALVKVIEAAFDYRGDVTIALSSGEKVEGYLSNRESRGPEPFVQVFPSDGSPPRKLLYRSIRGIAFTGRDGAAGKSWETWVSQYEAKKLARKKGEQAGGGAQ